MLHFQIDPQSGIPIYRQLMDQVKYYIASGVMKPGSKLPSIRELSKTLAYNPSTIVKAYNELEHEGVIESRQGKGFFIAATAQRISKEERNEAIRRLIKQLLVEAKQMGASEADILQLLEEERLKMNPGSEIEISLLHTGDEDER